MKAKYLPLVLTLLAVPAKAQDNTINVRADTRGYIGVGATSFSQYIDEKLSIGPCIGYAGFFAS